MKVLEIELSEKLTDIFYLWCDITKYPKVETSFKDFIQDALLYDQYPENIEIKKIYEHSDSMLCVRFDNRDWWIYSWGHHGEDISIWIRKYNTYLKEIYENIR